MAQAYTEIYHGLISAFNLAGDVQRIQMNFFLPKVILLISGPQTVSGHDQGASNSTRTVPRPPDLQRVDVYMHGKLLNWNMGSMFKLSVMILVVEVLEISYNL